MIIIVFCFSFLRFLWVLLVLQLQEYPRKLGELEEGEEVTMTCAIRSLCQGCNPIVEFFREDDLGTFLPVTDSFWKVSYKRECSKDPPNLLTCSLTIPSYDGLKYAGHYRCTWWESRNRNINESRPYTLGKHEATNYQLC